ncbi:hypothetical protein V8E52_006229 [Russula decolorans]
MGYHHPRQTNPYLQGNVQGGQPQDTGYNNQRSARSNSVQPSVQTGGNPTVSPTLNRSMSGNRPSISGQAQPFEAYGTGQNRERKQIPVTNCCSIKTRVLTSDLPAGVQYVPPTNIPQYTGAQGQIQSPSYQDPSQAYQSAEYFPLEGQPPHVVPQQNRTHQSPPQQPSVPHNPPHSVQGQYPQYERGDVGYSAGHLQQRRPSSSQYPQQQQQQQQQHQQRSSSSSSSQYPQQHQQQQHQQRSSSSSSQYPQQQQHQQQPPSTQVYSQQPQSSPPQYQHQQPSSTQPYSQHQQSSPTQQRQQYQASSQQYTQQQHSPPLRQQGNFATAPGSAASSIGPNVPGGIYETPGEEIRPSRSVHRGTTHAGPPCRLSGCRNPVIRDEATQELTEYCSLDHMQEVTRRGAPLCPACNMCPRRIDGRYCGSSCDKYVRERRQQTHQQQQQHPRPPSGVRPTPPRNVTLGTAPGELSPVGNFAPDKQHLLPGGPAYRPTSQSTAQNVGVGLLRAVVAVFLLAPITV